MSIIRPDQFNPPHKGNPQRASQGLGRYYMSATGFNQGEEINPRFYEDFDSQAVGSGPAGGNEFFQWGGSSSTTITDAASFLGTKSLSINYTGNPTLSADTTAEQRFSFTDPETELWIRYKLWIPLNYTHRDSGGANNNKGLIMLWGNGEAGYAGVDAGPTISLHFIIPNDLVNGVSTDNPDGSIIYGAWRSNDKTVYNYYAPDGDTYGSLGAVSPRRGITKEDYGKWLDIVIHVKTSTVPVTGVNDRPADSNGALQLWIDYNLIFSVTNANNYYDLHGGPDGWNRGYLFGYANSGFNENTTLYVDDLYFGRSHTEVGFYPKEGF